MPFSYCLLQCIKQSAFNPVIGICMDSDACRNLICGTKSDPLNIIRKFIRIFFHHFVYTHTIMIIYLCCQFRRNSILLKIDHCLSQILFIF